MARRRRARQYIFYIHKILTDFRLMEMEAFIHHSRSAMKESWEQFRKDFDAKTVGWRQGDIDSYVEGIVDDIAMLRDASPQMLRQTHCMMLYGTFEHALADLCRTVHRDNKIAASPPAVLQRVLPCAKGKAFLLTLRTHCLGRGVVWIGSREVAELKADQLNSYGPDPLKVNAGAQPLKVTVEPAR